jgi:hypothetical protein
MCFIQIALQDESGSYSIIPGLSPALLGLSGLHQAFSRHCGQTLIPELYRNIGMVAQFLSKDGYLLRLLPQTSIHRTGQAYYNLLSLMLANNISNSLDIRGFISAVDNGKRAG